MMDKVRDEDEGPISSEQMKREGWRENEAMLHDDDAPGHTLPESERDRTDLGETKGASRPPQTILPPD